MNRDFRNHANPAWRDRADYLLIAKIGNDTNDSTELWEQLWAKKLTDDVFQLCCIPFFVYDLHLGDVVETSHDEQHEISRVVESGGHVTFRVLLEPPRTWVEPNPVMDYVRKQTGLLAEAYSEHLLAIDAESLELASALSDFLAQLENAGYLQYETGRT